MKYTDLHCDTAFEMYKKRERLRNNSLHIDLDKTREFERYTQIFAIWSDNEKSDDEVYKDFFHIKDRFFEELKTNNIPLLLSGSEYEKSAQNCAAFLAVEGGSLLGRDISRLYRLYECGVRLLTLVWGGENHIGGAHDTDIGLSDFGIDVVRRCEELGIIIDVSHLSDKGFYRLADIAKKPFIASHSSSRSAYNHTRNLTDEQFLIIKEMGGVVGISFADIHLAEKAALGDIIRHIEHYLSLGGEDTVSLGCDFDGADMPEGIRGIESIPALAAEFERYGFRHELTEKFFYKNADRFIINNL